MIASKTHRLRSTLASAIRSAGTAPGNDGDIVQTSARSRYRSLSFDKNFSPRNAEFSTLYELQSTACKAFAQNTLFGTYKPNQEDFEYMTYHDFGNEVNCCRTMLRNLGE
jgi:hypothetical protein